MNVNKGQRKDSQKVLGIDLGTTNSCASIYSNNKSEVFKIDGQRTMPSVISFKKNKDGGLQILVGIAAERRAITDPQETVSSIKSKMGEKDYFRNIFEKKYTPQELQSLILGHIVEKVSETLGEQIKKVVVTVPAYFNDVQRQGTKDAGEIAGLQVLRIINEPTSAALAYGLDKKDQTILVFDLGGGTFDVSILEISGGVFKVLATGGISDLGGDKYDSRIVKHLVEEFKKIENIDLFENGDKMIQQRLYTAARKAKHELSSSLEAEINEPFITINKQGVSLNLKITITRREFEKITEDLTKSAIKKVWDVLKDSKLSINEIKEILLVGGSTRMSIIPEILQKEFKKIPNKNIDPDEVVAIGAGIQGAILGGTANMDVVLIDVTSLSFGIETENGINRVIIPRNTSIPTSKKEIFSTAADYQDEVIIKVNQGERPLSVDNKELGTFRLKIKNPRKRGIPQIEVELAIDSNGILSVSAEDKDSGEKQSITIQGAQSLSREEIDEMIRKAEENKAEDQKTRNNIEILNRSQAYLYTFEQQIDSFKKHKDFKEDDSQFQNFKKKYDELKKVTEERNYQEIQKKLDEVEELMKLSSELMKKMPEGNKKDDEKKAADDIDVKEEKK